MRGMRLLDRYICREVISHGLLGLAVFTFIFFVPQLVRLMGLVVQHATRFGSIFLLFATVLPGVLVFTLPIAILVGVLLGLGRLSADSEIIALNALGMGRDRLLFPVGLLALAAATVTLVMTFWLQPIALRTFYGLEAKVIASQATYEIQPRVFQEEFSHLVLYVQDIGANAMRWRGVFLAQSGPAGSSQVTLAKEAIVIPERGESRLELRLMNGTTYAYDPHDPTRYSLTTFATTDLPVEFAQAAAAAPPRSSPAAESLGALLASHDRPSRVEFERRIAFPAACFIFALVAVPLGARPRRGGRAFGLVLALVLLCGYYLLFVVGSGKAREGALPVWLGVWLANIVIGILGIALAARADKLGASRLADPARNLAEWLRRPWPAPRLAQNGPLRSGPRPRSPRPARMARFPLLLDRYVLRSFLFYFAITLVGFVLLFEAFTFFDLLDDIARHNASYAVVADYFGYLTPLMFYQLTPLAALVATLATLGVMSKNNEITAIKASGMSLHRLVLPLLVVGVLLAGGLFLLDDTYLPYANQKQDALRNQIKGRPAQTFFQARLRWIFGENDKIYNYELFDSDHGVFAGLNVFELDPASFQLRRRVFAQRAWWEPHLQAWVLEQGWVRDFSGAEITRFVPFRVYSLPELDEPPNYFEREVRQSYQMNWRQLRQYIRQMEQAGFDVARLSVEWQKKFSFPLLTAVIILLGVPFAFLVGTRGALGGLALAVAIGIVYWATAALFEAMGGVGQLPPLLAGWAPDGIFGFFGIYLFLKMKT
jgi:LPS export ABC transporter permease LptF/LPS export ABC transporter permease LptG